MTPRSAFSQRSWPGIVVLANGGMKYAAAAIGLSVKPIP
jgi:hypothetical protein